MRFSYIESERDLCGSIQLSGSIRNHEYCVLCARASGMLLGSSAAASLSLVEESLQYTLNSRHGLILDEERAMVALDCVHFNGFRANL